MCAQDVKKNILNYTDFKKITNFSLKINHSLKTHNPKSCVNFSNGQAL